MALTPGVSPRCQATSRAQLVASLAPSGSVRCGQTHRFQPSPKQQQQQQHSVAILDEAILAQVSEVHSDLAGAWRV